MLQSKKISICRIPFESLPLMNNSSALDPETMCSEWYRLWSLFGFTDHQWLSRATKVEEYTRRLLDDKLLIYKQQIFIREQLVKQSLDDYEDILQRTGLSSPIQLSNFNELKLKDQEIYIEKKMQELLTNEDELIHQQTELENKQKHLCSLLNSTPVELDHSMTLLEMNQKLQDHIKMLSELKELRLTQVSSYYFKIKEYSERLEWTPPSSTSTVEYLLLQQFDRCLTVDGINEIESTILQLENQIELQKTYFSKLHNQLDQLYKCLKKDSCLAYKTEDENLNAFVIKQLEHEIACCREERMKNGKEYCHTIHQQISHLIQQSHLGINERVILDKLSFESLSPELLDAYDREYERISELYEKRKVVLDAYDKWLSYWNEFVAFTKASTDPGRFHIRGYNADVEGRKRKQFHKELPMIEQEFLSILSENNDPIFLFDNVPIKQKFDEVHQQLPSTVMPVNTPGRTPAAPRSLGLTPVRSKTPATTPHRVVANKEPFILGTATTSTARRPVKTPASIVARKLLNKMTNHADDLPIRAKPRPPPPQSIIQSSPPQSLAILLVHPPACTDDQSLDFSLLHTKKNLYGQTKVMTSTPNSSYMPIEIHNGKTAHNIIGQRKSKRRSKRTPLPLLVVEDTSDDTFISL